MTETKEGNTSPEDELPAGDRAHITGIFMDQIVPKLKFMNARTGTLNCGFAGDKYRNWNLVFKEARSGFEILDFEYDEQGADITLYE
ncbi:MAG: hypothetical protein ACLFVT_07580 [Syntrophobacteria bacterium]